MRRYAIVDVTADDIEHGEPQDCNCCPVAKAFGRLIADDVTASVYQDFILLEREDTHESFEVTPPSSHQDFVSGFDQLLMQRPFSYMIFVPKTFWHFFKPKALKKEQDRPG